MKQSRLFPAALVSFMALVLIGVSHLSAAVTSCNDFEGKSLDLTKWSYQDRTYNPYDSGNSRPGQEIYAHAAFSRGSDFGNEVRMRSMSPISIGSVPSTFWHTDKAMPDELLTLGVNSQTSIPYQPSDWAGDMQPASEPADDIVGNNDADCIKSMRTPAPGSLLLVALGLLSLRITRRLRY
jgi:hypothetical protein